MRLGRARALRRDFFSCPAGCPDLPPVQEQRAARCHDWCVADDRGVVQDIGILEPRRQCRQPTPAFLSAAGHMHSPRLLRRQDRPARGAHPAAHVNRRRMASHLSPLPALLRCEPLREQQQPRGAVFSRSRPGCCGSIVSSFSLTQ